MKAADVIQARMRSSHLPTTVLLPIAGLPLTALVAQRAANQGHYVIVAISMAPEDEALAGVLARYGIAVFRGSRNDVLGRFVGAIGNCDASTPVLRLTADNVIPDGAPIKQVEQLLGISRARCLACNKLDSGLPYRVSAKIASAGRLGEATMFVVQPAGREHVAPWLIRHHGEIAKFGAQLRSAMSQYRCSVGTIDDYLVIERIFRDLVEPVHAAPFNLLPRLAFDQPRPLTACPVEKFVLGAVQPGVLFGIANCASQRTSKDAPAIIRNGVVERDTARVAGVSESVSRKHLRGVWRERAKIPTRTSWKRLRKHRYDDVIGVLRLSVHTPGQLAEAVDDIDLTYGQLSSKVLTGRWSVLVPKFVSVKGRQRVIIHCPRGRSDPMERKRMTLASPLLDPSDQLALVAGMTRHLGSAVARAPAETGTTVLENSGDACRAEHQVAVIRDAGSHARLAVSDLIGRQGQQATVVVYLAKDLPHILIKTAYAGDAGTTENLSSHAYADSYDVAVASAYFLLQILLLPLQCAVHANGYGSLVHVASVYLTVRPDIGLCDDPLSPSEPYHGAANTAPIQRPKHVAYEFGMERNCVNSLSPRALPARQVEEQNPEFVARPAGKVLMERVEQPEEIRDPILFFVSAASSFVTGANIIIYGGRTAW